MADELVQEAANEAREVFGRRLICLHDHGETDAVVAMRIIRKLAESRGETLRQESCWGWGALSLPRQEHFAAGYERDVALFPEGRPHALESAGEDIHGEFAAAFRVFDEEGDTGREPAGGRVHATESVSQTPSG